MSGYVRLPKGWAHVSVDGPGPFVSAEVFRRRDGSEVRWESRRHRKRSPALQRAAQRADHREPAVWWRPARRSWAS